MSDTPLNGADTLPPGIRVRCANCAFCSLEQIQGQIMRMRICHFAPPSSFIAPGPQPNTMSIRTQFPVVQDDMYCHQFRPSAAALASGESGQIASPVSGA